MSMQQMALQERRRSATSPDYREAACATPRHPGGLEADRHCNSDPPLPPPDFHHYANAHGFVSDGGRSLSTGHDARLSEHAATTRPRMATRGFVPQDSSGDNTIVCKFATWHDHAREV
jgi:hypothetical protein